MQQRVGTKQLCLLFRFPRQESVFARATVISLHCICKNFKFSVRVCWVNLPRRVLIPPVCFETIVSFPMHTSKHTICIYANMVRVYRASWQRSIIRKPKNVIYIIPSNAFRELLCFFKRKKEESLYVETVRSMWNWQMHNFIAND